jgi:hypothetical protein
MFANMRPGGGVWAINPKLSVCCSVLGVPCETAVWGDDARWWVQVNAVVAAGGPRICQCGAGGGIWAQNLKPSVRGSVSGAPCETVVWGDSGMWLVLVNDMEAVGRLSVNARPGGLLLLTQ